MTTENGRIKTKLFFRGIAIITKAKSKIKGTIHRAVVKSMESETELARPHDCAFKKKEKPLSHSVRLDFCSPSNFPDSTPMRIHSLKNFCVKLCNHTTTMLRAAVYGVYCVVRTCTSRG